MKLKNILEALFKAGQPPNPETMLEKDGSDSEWEVTMLTGLFPNLGRRWIRHRKLFAKGGDYVVGCNVLFDDVQVGWFALDRDWYAADVDDQPSLFINYHVTRNGNLTRIIRDYIRTTRDPNLMIGRFYCGNHFVGYFTLTRLPKRR